MKRHVFRRENSHKLYGKGWSVSSWAYLYLCTFCCCSTLDVPFGTGSHQKGGAKGHPVEGNHPFLLETVRKSDRWKRRVFSWKCSKSLINFLKFFRIILVLFFILVVSKKWFKHCSCLIYFQSYFPCKWLKFFGKEILYLWQ